MSKSSKIIINSKSNLERETNVYFTNFRVVCLSKKNVFDIPLYFVQNCSIKKPGMLNFKGSKWIQIDLPKDPVRLSSSCPAYIKENYSPEEINNTVLYLPSYVMIKFKDHTVDLERPFEILQMQINAKEYNFFFKAKEEEKKDPSNSVVLMAKTQVKGIGISKIQEMMKEKMKAQSQVISGGFGDANKFRENAEQLIEIAKNIKVRLVNLKANQRTNEVNSILSKIGYVDPVTKEVAGSEYYIKVAEQINNYFSDYFAKNPTVKVITLIDAYCIYNRARGGNTISPKDMMQALKSFSSVSNKIMIKNFNNEMIVLHTKDYSNENILKLIINYLNEKKEDSVSTSEISQILNVKNVLLEKILINDMLLTGRLCADESDLEVRYYLNKILAYKI